MRAKPDPAGKRPSPVRGQPDHHRLIGVRQLVAYNTNLIPQRPVKPIGVKMMKKIKKIIDR